MNLILLMISIDENFLQNFCVNLIIRVNHEWQTYISELFVSTRTSYVSLNKFSEASVQSKGLSYV